MIFLYPPVFALAMWLASHLQTGPHLPAFAVSTAFLAAVVHTLAPVHRAGQMTRAETLQHPPGIAPGTAAGTERATLVRTSRPRPLRVRPGLMDQGTGGQTVIIPARRATVLTGNARLEGALQALEEHAGAWNTSPLEAAPDGRYPEDQVPQGSTLMIENAGGALHHSRLPEYWQQLLATAGRRDAGILATAQSIESLRAFLQAAGESGQDAQVVRVRIQTPGEGNPEVTVFDAPEALDAVRRGEEIR